MVVITTVWVKPFIKIVKGGNYNRQVVVVIDKRTRMDKNTRYIPFHHFSITLNSSSTSLQEFHERCIKCFSLLDIGKVSGRGQYDQL